jgi:hypothetical protein
MDSPILPWWSRRVSTYFPHLKNDAERPHLRIIFVVRVWLVFWPFYIAARIP